VGGDQESVADRFRCWPPRCVAFAAPVSATFFGRGRRGDHSGRCDFYCVPAAPGLFANRQL